MGSHSPDEALAMLKAMRADYALYAERALKVRSKAGDIVPFIFNDAQRLVHAKLEAQRARYGKVRALVLKGRQQGISTYVEGRFYWKVSGEYGKRAFILTHLAEATTNLFAMTRRYHEHCPPILRPSTVAASSASLKFGVLDSEFSVATAGSSGTGRSATAQYFHGSEVAFWDNAVEHMAGIGQIVPSTEGTEIILESTGNGQGNWFHAAWLDAERGLGDYIPVFVPWFLHAEYQTAPPDGWAPSLYDGAEYGRLYGLLPEQLYWRECKIRDDFRGDTALFDQEYPAEPLLAFRRQAEESYISPALAARARRTRDVEARGARIMAVDPAEYGDDDTVIGLRQGRAVTHYERFHGKSPMEVVGLVGKRAEAWGADFIAVDATGIGSGICDRLRELGYPVIRVIVGERANDDARYVLIRDEIWGDMKAWFEDAPCSIPDDDALQTDLTSVPYTYDSSRRLKLKSKEYMKSKGLKSPDGGDMIALTFAVPSARSFGAKTVNHQRRRNWRSG